MDILAWMYNYTQNNLRTAWYAYEGHNADKTRLLLLLLLLLSFYRTIMEL